MKTCWWKFGHDWHFNHYADFHPIEFNPYRRMEPIQMPVWKCSKCGLFRVVFLKNKEGSVVIKEAEKQMEVLPNWFLELLRLVLDGKVSLETANRVRKLLQKEEVKKE